MNDRIFNQKIEKLRSQERLDRLPIDEVIEYCLKDRQVNSVIDIGTGSGLFAEKFYIKNLKVCGIDSNQEMIDYVKNLLPEIEFKLASAENIPYKDKTFDISFLGLVLHEVDDYVLALKEAKRVTKLYTYVFEWEYKEQDFGPPKHHRLRQEQVEQFTKDAGYSNIELIKLKDLILYKLYI